MRSKYRDKSQKFEELYVITLQWLIIKQMGDSLEDYFLKKGLKRIAVYGVGILGELLINELKNSRIEVCYAIDKNVQMAIGNRVYSSVNIFKPTDELALVDAVVVTAVHFYDDIKSTLIKKYDCPIISLAEVVYYG